MTSSSLDPSPRVRGRALGWLAMVVAILAWTGFALSARAIARSSLSVLDVQAIRFLIPTLALAPWWRRAWRELRAAPPWSAVAVAAGAGVPFFLLTATGAAWSSATHVSIINLGVAPVLVGILLAVTTRHWPARRRLVGSGLIVVGVLVLAVAMPGAGAGVLVLLASAVLWALYSAGQAKGRFSPTTAILVMCAPSAPIAVLLALPTVGDFGRAPWPELVSFILLQGVASGFVSTVAYAVALSRLGLQTATVAGALTPVVALASAAVLHEALVPVAWLGLGLVCAGIAVQAIRPAAGTLRP